MDFYLEYALEMMNSTSNWTVVPCDIRLPHSNSYLKYQNPPQKDLPEIFLHI